MGAQTERLRGLLDVAGIGYDACGDDLTCLRMHGPADEVAIAEGGDDGMCVAGVATPSGADAAFAVCVAMSDPNMVLKAFEAWRECGRLVLYMRSRGLSPTAEMSRRLEELGVEC